MFERDEVIIGHGKQLLYCDTVDGTYTKVDGTIEVNLPERELEAEEITNDDSPDFHKDYNPGMYEPGTVPFTYKYTKTQFAALETIFQLATVAATRSSATKFWKVILTDGSTASFRGFLTKHDLPMEQGTVNVEAEMQVCGKMSYDEGESSSSGA
jgi:hypothetical protein